MEVALRPVTRADFTLLGDWLREPLVHEWWHDDPGALEQQYGAAIDGREPTVLRLGELVPSGEPVGFVQSYPLSAEPGYVAELAPFLPIPTDAWSLDYFVASEAHRGRGVGTALVRAAVEAVGAHPVVVPVHADNAASAGVLRAVGFVLASTADLEPDNPAHSRAHLVFLRWPAADRAAGRGRSLRSARTG